MINNTVVLIQEYTFRPPFSTVLQNLRFLLKLCTTAPRTNPSKPTLSSEKRYILASLVKGRWIDGKPQTVALLHLLAIYPSFLCYKLFCRQDGGIATPNLFIPTAIAKER